MIYFILFFQLCFLLSRRKDSLVRALGLFPCMIPLLIKNEIGAESFGFIILLGALTIFFTFYITQSKNRGING